MKDDKLFALAVKLSLSQPPVRIQAARALGAHPLGHAELHALRHALHDDDPAVRVAVVDAVDRIIAAHPEALEELLQCATDAEERATLELARYLVHVGTPQAVEAALPIIAGDAWGKERLELLQLLAVTDGLTNERLGEILDEGPRQDDNMHRTAAEILGLRGVAEGYQELFRSYHSDSLFDEFIGRGPEGVRILCRAFPQRDCAGGEIAQRLAERRRKTEAVVHQLVADPSSGGVRTAIEVLGYWDEPRNVELLMQIAQDPSRESHLREEAVVALCRIEAPEAMDLLIRTMLDRGQTDQIRRECAWALGEIGKPEALDALQAVAESDPDWTLRGHASEAIGVIQNPAAA